MKDSNVLKAAQTVVAVSAGGLAACVTTGAIAATSGSNVDIAMNAAGLAGATGSGVAVLTAKRERQ